MATPVKLPVHVEKIVRHTETVKEFILRPKRRPPLFRPGQFLHLAIDPYDPSFNWPESRVFSIASSPGEEILRVVFGVKGAFTARMFNEVKEGDELWVKLPYGSFTFREDGRPLVLIAGGTGITPFMSYLAGAVDSRTDNTISLYYGMKSYDVAICRDLLKRCMERIRNFSCCCYFEDGSAIEGLGRCEKGMLSTDRIIGENRARENCVFYLSGPIPMIRNFRTSLVAHDVPESNIKVDDWE